MKLFGSNGNKDNPNREYNNPAYEEVEQNIRRPVQSVYDDARQQENYYAAERDYGVRQESDEEIDQVIAAYQKKKRRRRLTALVVVLALILVGVSVYAIWVKPPEVELNGPGFSAPTQSQPPEQEPEEPGVQETEPVDPEPTVSIDPNETRNMQAYTFLVVGSDQAAGLTDTILVGKFDTRNHELNVISIPRDTIANVTWRSKKINTIFNHTGGVDAMYEGEGLLEGITDLLGFRVDCWAVVDIEAFELMVNTIGGVYYDVPFHMYYNDPSQGLMIDIPEGYQLLNGENALKVVRYRYGNDMTTGALTGYANGDIGRISTQQDFLMSVAKQMLQLGNIPKIDELCNIFVEYVDTNLTAGNIAFFAQEFLKLSSEDIHFGVLDADYYGSINSGSYVLPYVDRWLEQVNTQLNPYYEEVTRDDIDILEWDPVTGYATSTQGTKFYLTDFYDYVNMF